jgi:hypothetical protein
MNELERQLRELGGAIEYPDTPALDRSVRARLEAEHEAAPLSGPPERSRHPGIRALAIAALVLAGAAATAYAVSEDVREAVRDVLGLSGVTIERTELPPPPRAERSLELGERVALDTANRAVAFEPLVPRALGAPEEVFVRRSVPGGELSLVYGPSRRLPPARSTGIGLLISEFRGDLLGDYVRKVVTGASRIERLRIGGGRGIWIAGAPHFFFYGTDGAITEDELEVAENVLLLQRGSLLVRLEGALDRTEASRIARSLASR